MPMACTRYAMASLWPHLNTHGSPLVLRGLISSHFGAHGAPSVATARHGSPWHLCLVGSARGAHTVRVVRRGTTFEANGSIF